MGGLDTLDFCEYSSPEDDKYDKLCNNGVETIVPNIKGEFTMEGNLHPGDADLSIIEEAKLSEEADKAREEAELKAEEEYFQGRNNGTNDGSW